MTEQEKREQIRIKRQKQRRKQELIRSLILITLGLILGIILCLGVQGIHHLIKSRGSGTATADASVTKVVETQPDIDVELLTPNEYSRPQLALEEVNAIVIHYTANPGTTAIQNRDYFEGLADSGETYASSHFIIGLEGEIVQCIPTTEQSYASNARNSDTISIECCHEDETGEFNDETYDSLVYMTAWLLGKFDLTTDDIIRHYDITGKECPKYFVDHEDAWEQFKEDVAAYIDENGVEVDESEAE